jgi:phage regulator Rha-like protein
MFQLTQSEWNVLISQFAISKTGRGGRRILPYAFTEQGVSMLSSVLRSKKAIEINIAIMRAFVEMRHVIISPYNLQEQINELRKTMLLYMDKNDKRVDAIMQALNALIAKPPEPRRVIGFQG